MFNYVFDRVREGKTERDSSCWITTERSALDHSAILTSWITTKNDYNGSPVPRKGSVEDRDSDLPLGWSNRYYCFLGSSLAERWTKDPVAGPKPRLSDVE